MFHRSTVSGACELGLLGRIRHLRALRLYGARHLWHVIEPHGTDSSLTVKRMYDAEHRVKAASIAHFQLKADSGTPYFLQVDMSSPRDIIGFRIVSPSRRKRSLSARMPARPVRVDSARSTTSCCPNPALAESRRPSRRASRRLLMKAEASCAPATLSSPRPTAFASPTTAARFNSRQKKPISTRI